MLTKSRLAICISLGLFSPLTLAQSVTEVETQDVKQELKKKKESAIERISVTGHRMNRAETSPLPVLTLSEDELVHRRQGGLGETLAGLPGIHMDNFGGGSSRPVVRGQTVPRIEILSNGANVYDASAISPDHAITTDPLLLEAIEVQRGPAAIRYGGNAVNGAINLIDNKVPTKLPDNNFSGAGEARLGTGDNEKTVVGKVTGGIGDFAVHVEGSNHKSKDYKVPSKFGNDKLKDSFAEGSSAAIGASWITDSGYIGAAYTKQQNKYGLPGHTHSNASCHTHSSDLHCVPHDSFKDPFAEGANDADTAFIQLKNERIDVRGDYQDLIPIIEHTRIRLSHTNYAHDEIDGNTEFSGFTNKVYDARLEFAHESLWGFEGLFGLQYTDGVATGINNSTRHKGKKPFELETQSQSIFWNENRNFGPVEVNLGVRKEWVQSNVKKIDTEVLLREYRGFSQRTIDFLKQSFGPDFDDVFGNEFFDGAYPTIKHAPLSASLGFAFDLNDDHSLGLAFSHSQRAPTIRENYASGNNLATNSYEIGLAVVHLARRDTDKFPALRKDVLETTKSIDFTIAKNTGKFQFEFNAYYQDVDDYIYVKLIEEERVNDKPHRFFAYTTADASFFGIDAQMSYDFSDDLTVTIFGDYIKSKLKGGTDKLPRISPARLGARYIYTYNDWMVNYELVHTFTQNDHASYETRTSGYNMMNATVSYKLDVGNDNPLEVYLRGTNLTNELAFAHTSFVKTQSPLRGRNVVLGIRHEF
ncbi:TonB-dependent receptor domain-containing protein [Parashewanella curva]|uniref:TonB-dependent receptor domain-containing protein n=1 Tax=Parashewanella curva TaxID=2338552 RepID=UPI001A9D38A3|nr:TonB-dependent receptor [Parashewanella curva]